MLDLDAVEPELRKRLNPLASPVLPRMCPDSERTCGMRERDCFADLETVLGNEARPSGSKKPVECFTRVTHVSAAYQGAGDMRPTNRSAACLFHHCLDVDVDAEPAQSFDYALCAHLARVAKVCELDLEFVRPGYVQCEEMNLARPVMRAELYAANDPDPEWTSSEFSFLKTCEGVVIRKRNRCEPRGSRGLHDC